MRSLEPDILIVGGEPLSLATAHQAVARTSKKICLVRVTDSDQPRSAAKRNLGLDSSGLFEFGIDPDGAATMLLSSNRLHLACGLRRCQEPGVMGVATPEEAEELLRVAGMLGIDVTYLEPDDAWGLIGQYLNPAHLYFLVPDTRLNLPHLMKALRQDIQQSGRADFIECAPDEEPTIELEAGANNGLLVRAGGVMINAQTVILCSDYRIPRMLDRAGIRHELAVRVAPVIRASDAYMIKAPAFINKTASLVISHQQAPNGRRRNIIWNNAYRDIGADEIDNLYATDAQVNSLLEQQPAVWRSFLSSDDFSVTASPAAFSLREPASLKPLVYDAGSEAGLGGLVFGISPSVANTWLAAEMILEKIGAAGPQSPHAGDVVEYRISSRSWGRVQTVGKRWNPVDRMHWDYENLDDREGS